MAFAASPRLFIAIPHPSFLLRAAEWSQASSLRASSATDAPNGSRSPALSAKRSLNVLLCPLWVISGKAQTEHIMSALPLRVQLVTATLLVVYRQGFRIPRSSAGVD